jgi:hypothetical protein
MIPWVILGLVVILAGIALLAVYSSRAEQVAALQKEVERERHATAQLRRALASKDIQIASLAESLESARSHMSIDDIASELNRVFHQDKDGD